MAWQKLDSETLGTAQSSITNDIAAKKFLHVLFHGLDPSAADEVHQTRINGQTGTIYSSRSSLNGAADTTATSATSIQQGISTATQSLSVEFWINISSEEKMCIVFHVEQNTAGASNVPNRRELVGKVAYTSAQITSIEKSFATRTYAADSNLTTFGTD